MATFVCIKRIGQGRCGTFNRNLGECRACGTPAPSAAGEDGLAVKKGLVEALAVYLDARETAIEFQAAMTAADTALKTGPLGHMHVDSRTHANRWEVKDLDRGFWVSLFAALEIERFMSAARVAELRKAFETDPPVPTLEHVLQFSAQVLASAGSEFETKVRAVARLLTPHHGKLKSQKVVGQTAVISYAVEWWGASASANYHRSEEFGEIEQVVNQILGRGYAAKREIANAIREASAGDGTHDLGWATIKIFRNGNLHLRFADMTIPNAINRIAYPRGLSA